MSKKEKQPKVFVNWVKLITIVGGFVIGFIVIVILLGRIAK